MNLKIILYTTPGCFACNVMERILHEALSSFLNVPFERKVIELNSAGTKLAKELDITDFPTTRFFNSEKNVKIGELKGTYPIEEVTKLLNNLVALP